jgi:orotidine-5'-phosphate decarboxylase
MMTEGVGTPSGVIVALDFPEARLALQLAERLDPARVVLKVGLELYTRSGPPLVESLVARGHRVFLDLKFHDIPNTVAAACRAACDLGVWMLNVHAAGGPRMLAAAREAVGTASDAPRLLAVTLLTSLDATELDALDLTGTAADRVLRWSELAAEASLDGVVCSSREARMLRLARGPQFLLVCPGIRPQGSSEDDQRRTLTPREAQDAGADWLVIGRPVTAATDPLQALAQIEAQLLA